MAKLEITIPNWLDKICAWPVLCYRKKKYGDAFRRIPLGEGKFTLVSPQDFYSLNIHHWTFDGKNDNFYAVRNSRTPLGKSRILRMHRVIMAAPDGLLVDHKNLNALDNRRQNIRLATTAQNMHNRRKIRSNTTSQFIGVHFDKICRNYKAAIRHEGEKIYLGRFDNEIDAAKAYDAAAKKYHGEFARLNFPEEAEGPNKTNSVRKNGLKQLIHYCGKMLFLL